MGRVRVPGNPLGRVPRHELSKTNVGFTVCLIALMAFSMSSFGIGLALDCRMGNLLLLHFTARGFPRLQLETTRSARISSNTAS